MSDLLSALALAIALEGIILALFPNMMRRYMASVLQMSDSVLRISGLAAAILAVGGIALVRFYQTQP